MSGPGVCIVILLITLLAACAPLQTLPPEQRTTIISAPAPLPVPCFTEDQRPIQPIPTPVDPETASTEQLAAAELADAVAWRDYAAAVDAIFIACQQKGVTP